MRLTSIALASILTAGALQLLGINVDWDFVVGQLMGYFIVWIAGYKPM